MPFVLDASVAVAWAFEDEDHPVAANALQLIVGDSAVAPALWWFEVRNALLSSEIGKRTTAARNAEFLSGLNELSIEIAMLPDESDVLALAREQNLTFYDASYLELAKRLKLPLATLDKAIRRAARAESVRLVE